MLLLVGGAVSHGARPGRGDGGLVVVGVDRGASLSAVARRVEAQGYTVVRELADLHALEARAAPRDASAVAPRLAAIPGVRYAEPVVRVTAADMPADPLFSRQYPYLAAVNAP
ncbi:MAG: S8 family serine peptidase, partial [Dehalococcoidia bacterium]